MSLSTIQLLQRLNAGVEGVKTTPDKFPTSVAASQLPLVLCRSEDGTARTTGGQTESTRLYSSIFLLVKKDQKTLPLAQALAEEMEPRVVAAYTNPDNRYLAYGDPNQVKLNTHLPDGVRMTGVIEQEYLSEIYYAFRVSASITEVEHTT